MKNSLFETIIGFIVIAFSGVFLYYSYDKSGKIQHGNSYNLVAKFDNIDGITIGSEVKLSGIKIGEVTSSVIDGNSYKAMITIYLNDSLKIPTDSSAQIASSGLLGDKYIAISPGADDQFLNPGQEIKYTQSSINFENLIGKMVFSKEESNKNSDEKK